MGMLHWISAGCPCVWSTISLFVQVPMKAAGTGIQHSSSTTPIHDMYTGDLLCGMWAWTTGIRNTNIAPELLTRDAWMASWFGRLYEWPVHETHSGIQSYQHMSFWSCPNGSHQNSRKYILPAPWHSVHFHNHSECHILLPVIPQSCSGNLGRGNGNKCIKETGNLFHHLTAPNRDFCAHKTVLET